MKKKRLRKLNPLDAAINGLDKAVGFMDKAEDFAVKVSEKNEARRRANNNKASIERLYPDDRGNAFLYFKTDDRRVDARKIGYDYSYAIERYYTFSGEDGKPVYHAQTKSTNKQIVILYDIKNRKVGEIREAVYRKQPYYHLSTLYGDAGTIYCTVEDRTRIFKYKSLILRHPANAKYKLVITDSDGSLIANMIKHKLNKCLVFHSHEDDVLMALFLLVIYNYSISKDRLENRGRYHINMRGSAG